MQVPVNATSQANDKKYIVKMKNVEICFQFVVVLQKYRFSDTPGAVMLTKASIQYP